MVELGGRIVTEFITVGPKTSSHLIDNDEKIKLKRQKKCVMKRKFQFEKFKDYKNCLKINQLDK